MRAAAARGELEGEAWWCSQVAPRYVRSAGDFTYAVVRGAGHIVPYDQGRAALDLITRFINDTPFTN